MGEGNPRKISGHWKQRTLALMLAALVLGTGPSAAAQSRDEFSYWDGNGNGDLTCSEALDRDDGLRLPAYKDNRDGTGITYQWLERQRSSDTDNDGIGCDSSSNPGGYVPRAQTEDPQPTGCPPDAETWRGLKVCAERSRDGYDRDEYGTGYNSFEDDIIAALPVTMKKNGQVYTPYSCIAFDITANGTAATDIEHIVALAEAHDSGIVDDRRRDIASDLDNLTIADPTVNRSEKSDRDAAEWRPERHVAWFAERVIAVKREYELSVDPAERDALETLLAGGGAELNCVAGAAVPGAPALSARGGNGTVTLRWNAPANDGDAPILSYDVRYRESGASWGAWAKVEGGASARSITIPGLTNGTSYEFQVRAVNGKGGGAEATTESTPMPELNFAHFANGEQGSVTITSEIVLVNVETSKTYPAVFFYNQMGEQIDAGMVVDLTGDLMITEDGGVSPAMGLKGLGEITISTHGRGALVTGSAKVSSDGRVGGVLRFAIPSLGVAGVGASEPVRDAIFPARWMKSGINTGAAIRNLSPERMKATCDLMQGGQVVESKDIPLDGDGHSAQFITEVFTETFMDAAMVEFVGSVRCRAPEGSMFTGVALEMDFNHRIFTTLPVIPVR